MSASVAEIRAAKATLISWDLAAPDLERIVLAHDALIRPQGELSQRFNQLVPVSPSIRIQGRLGVVY